MTTVCICGDLTVYIIYLIVCASLLIASHKVVSAVTTNRVWPYTNTKTGWYGAVDSNFGEQVGLKTYQCNSLQQLVDDCEGKDVLVMDESESPQCNDDFTAQSMWIGIGAVAYERNDGALILAVAFPSAIDSGNFFSVYEIDEFVCLLYVWVSEAIPFVVLQFDGQRTILSS